MAVMLVDKNSNREPTVAAQEARRLVRGSDVALWVVGVGKEVSEDQLGALVGRESGHRTIHVNAYKDLNHVVKQLADSMNEDCQSKFKHYFNL